jgi:hypothetical protein
VGQDAKASASLLMSINVASWSAMELWQTHADRRLSFWQPPLNGIASNLGRSGPARRLGAAVTTRGYLTKGRQTPNCAVPIVRSW